VKREEETEPESLPRDDTVKHVTIKQYVIYNVILYHRPEDGRRTATELVTGKKTCSLQRPKGQCTLSRLDCTGYGVECSHAV